MQWKSFKDEKPLEGQRVLVYDIDDAQLFNVGFYEKDYGGCVRTLSYYGSKHCMMLEDYNYWCEVPNLPEDMK